MLFVVNQPRHWPLKMPGVQIVSAKQYLTDPIYHQDRAIRVFNLCRSPAYQSLGYYVSLLAQAFMPTPFDWRIGVLNHRPLFACKYFMARRHWQIVHHNGDGHTEGAVQTLPLEDVPPQVIRTALKAANLIGDGLYGVDLKQVGQKVYVVEINDNPNIDHRYEDRVLKDALYHQIMAVLLDRIHRRKGHRILP